MRKIIDKKLLRVIDANFNRAKEGFRVCEDICRFVYDQRNITKRYKAGRHQLTAILEKLPLGEVIKARDIINDVGRKSAGQEFQRKDVADIFYANSQRVKESIRVLEEFVKLIDRVSAEDLKKLRYKVYRLEKDMLKRGSGFGVRDSKRAKPKNRLPKTV